MSWRGGKKADRGKKSNWSGGTASQEEPRRRWQDAASSTELIHTSRRRSQYRWAVTTLMALALLTTLILLLLYRTPRTPFIIITATKYTGPVPINAWAMEDRESFERLNNDNLSFPDQLPDWNLSGSQIEVVPDDFSLANFRSYVPLIVYISAHGIVNNLEQPCLLLPGGGLEPVEKLLDKISNKVSSNRNILLVLDCNRIRENWSMGIVYNTFADRVKELVEKKSSNIVVLLSAGPGQVSWTSADLGGSVFARYFQLGLAGAANKNKDSFVSLHELVSYLQHEVSSWSKANRGEPQDPMLIPADPKDFHIAYPSSHAEGTIAESFNERASKGANETARAYKDPWSQLDILRNAGLVRCNPIACRNFEHKLLRLEQLSYGGEAYTAEAKHLRDEVIKELDAAIACVKATVTSAADYYAISGDASWLHREDVGFSLAACEYFGSYSAKDIANIRGLWKQLIENPKSGSADSIVDASARPDVASRLAETQFRAALRQQQVHSLWPNAELDKVLKLREKADYTTLPFEQVKPSVEGAAVPHDQSRTPGDERAHYFERLVVQTADAKRRQAEDLFFVGPPNVPTKYEKLVTETVELYERASDVMTDASLAFEVRDEVLAKSAYLAEWLCDPLANISDREAFLTSKLIPLIDDAHELSKSINRVPTGDNAQYVQVGGDLPFRVQTKSVRERLHVIQQKYDELFNKLAALKIEDVGEVADWRQLEALLRTPLLPAPIREKLLKQRTDLSKKLQIDFVRAESEAKKREKEKGDAAEVPQDQGKKTPSYVDAVRKWEPHPLFKILRGPAGEFGTDLDGIDKANAAALERLKEPVTAKFEENTPSRSAEDDQIANARNRLSDAEEKLRAAAALIYEPTGEKAKKRDLISVLRRFDIQQLLIWNGQRAIDDFWQETVKTNFAGPYFIQEATSFFEAAESLTELTMPVVAKQIQNEERKLVSKTEPLPITARAQSSAEDEKGAVVSLEVGNDWNGFPKATGYAPVYLLDQSRGRMNLPIEGSPCVKVSTEAKVQRFNIKIDDTSAYSTALEAVTFFRGRMGKCDFNLPVNNGVRVDYVPHVYKDQWVTLNGEGKQLSSIDFILDCSWSMHDETLTGAEAQGAPKTAQRLELAKQQLIKMLDELVARNQPSEEIHVGVRFFGHRVNYVDGDPKKGMHVNPEFLNQVQRLQQIGPSDDIELARPLSSFDDTKNEDIKRRIATLVPTGETPLYRALKEALTDFPAASSDSRNYIIAITDGMNFQSKPDTSKQDVMDTWENHKVPIYILGFDIPAENNEAQIAAREYTDIANKTKGLFQPIRTGNDLLETLRRTLPPDLYTVSGSDVSPRMLNDKTPIDFAQLPKDYTVSFRSIDKKVRLEGGEAVELYATSDGHSIKAKPYKDGVERSYLRGTSNGEPILLRVHQPVREAAKDSVLFTFSIQIDPDARHFTYRPSETWVEITPMANSMVAGQPYNFYDVNFEPHQPVPVLKWNALNWPKDADKARIRFWCKYTPTIAAETIRLDTLLTSKHQVAGIDLTAKSGLEGKQYSISIEEREGARSPGGEDPHIRLETKLAGKPLRVVHQFNAPDPAAPGRSERQPAGTSRVIATHKYYFPAEMRERLERSDIATVIVTRGADMKKDALQLSPEGLTVPISAPAEVIYAEPQINGK